MIKKTIKKIEKDIVKEFHKADTQNNKKK